LSRGRLRGGPRRLLLVLRRRGLLRLAAGRLRGRTHLRGPGRLVLRLRGLLLGGPRRLGATDRTGQRVAGRLRAAPGTDRRLRRLGLRRWRLALAGRRGIAGPSVNGALLAGVARLAVRRGLR
jgi:hypothetical protein